MPSERDTGPTPRQDAVLTCFVLRQGPDGADQVLLLHRSDKVGSYRGRWAGVSGFAEGDPGRQAYVELREEAGLEPEDVTLLAVGEPLAVDSEESGRRWLVHPYLFRLNTDRPVRFDWEHTEYRWIDPGSLSSFDCVPKLVETLARVYPPPGTGGDAAPSP